MVRVDLVLWEQHHQQQWSQNSSLGALPTKQAGSSQEAIWSPMAGAEKEQDDTPGHSHEGRRKPRSLADARAEPGRS